MSLRERLSVSDDDRKPGVLPAEAGNGAYQELKFYERINQTKLRIFLSPPTENQSCAYHLGVFCM